MRIVVSGGSGFLGGSVTRVLRAAGHQVIVLTRRATREGDLTWSPASEGGAWVAAVQAADVVINLAGEGIADKRWSESRREAILRSRVAATRALAGALRDAVRPATFISGSAVGYYGVGDDEKTEADRPGADFLARVCVEWEREATAIGNATRVVLLRTGVVLARDGGALPRMALPFHFFAGGRVGSGRQFLSWIHLDDWIALVLWTIEHARIAGPLNLTAPQPVRNLEFTRTLARVLNRPAVMPVPAFALRLALGELADTALLAGQRVMPAVATAAGYEFRYPGLEDALTAIYSGRPT